MTGGLHAAGSADSRARTRLQAQRWSLCLHLALEIHAAKFGMGCDQTLNTTLVVVLSSRFGNSCGEIGNGL